MSPVFNLDSRLNTGDRLHCLLHCLPNTMSGLYTMYWAESAKVRSNDLWFEISAIHVVQEFQYALKKTIPVKGVLVSY